LPDNFTRRLIESIEMRHTANPHKILRSAVSLLSVALLLGCFCLIFTSATSSQSVALERDLDSHFLQHQTVKLDAATVAAQAHQRGRMTLASRDLSFDLDLKPHDLRALDYQAEEFGAEGLGRTIG
jgi:hypothetical protein